LHNRRVQDVKSHRSLFGRFARSNLSLYQQVDENRFESKRFELSFKNVGGSIQLILRSSDLELDLFLREEELTQTDYPTKGYGNVQIDSKGRVYRARSISWLDVDWKRSRIKQNGQVIDSDLLSGVAIRDQSHGFLNKKHRWAWVALQGRARINEREQDVRLILEGTKSLSVNDEVSTQGSAILVLADQQYRYDGDLKYVYDPTEPMSANWKVMFTSTDGLTVDLSAIVMKDSAGNPAVENNSINMWRVFRLQYERAMAITNLTLNQNGENIPVRTSEASLESAGYSNRWMGFYP